MQLPDEILRTIISFIPTQLVVGQVCKKFYEISCSLKAFNLRMEIPYKGVRKNLRVNIDDDKVFDNIMKSKRKVKTLYIHSDMQRTILPSTRVKLKKIIKQIGGNVVEVGIFSKVMTLEEFELFNLMPNLQKLSLDLVTSEKLKIPQSFQLRLNNLRQLAVSGSANVLEVFDRLPDNVLKKLFLSIDGEPTRKYFKNQLKLEEFRPHSYGFLDFQNIKLKIVIASAGKNIQEIISGQDEMRSLVIDVRFDHQEIADLICNDLKSLEGLEICCYSPITFFNIQNLKKLKKLSLMRFSLSDKIITTMKSKSLQELEVQTISKESLLQLSINCPNLRELKLHDCTALMNFKVDNILQYFPELERVYCDSRIFQNIQMCEHENLKYLNIKNNYQMVVDNIIVIISGCKNIEFLSTDVKFNAEQLETLLRLRPNLKSLCLREFSRELLEVVKNHGNNLHSLHFCFRGSESIIELMELKEIFKQQFTRFTFNGGPEHHVCLMRKTGNEEKCCEYWPLDRFDFGSFSTFHYYVLRSDQVCD